MVPGSTSALVRCGWAEANDLLRTYHDREWGQPVTQSRALWEALVLETFQAGLSWNTVLQNSENLRAAFCGSDPLRVAAFAPADQARLQEKAGLLRYRANTAAHITNAQARLAHYNAWQLIAALLV